MQSISDQPLSISILGTADVRLYELADGQIVYIINSYNRSSSSNE